MQGRSSALKRSVCPVSCTLDLIGDKWTLLVVRDLFTGKSHFHEFSGSPEGIASNILAERLDRLTRHGLVASKPSSERAGSSAYELTPRGRSLLPVLQALKAWGLEHIPGTEARMTVKGRS